ncbi:MAG: hypothetical protein BWZ07_02785 [Alphaproteobacteria bacterium ADurb.BinA280]|nr:MAG: hypothetical protein BWZ07_02785 [Alphaproteobacteria bacterium ADurb.BinA280]
MDDQSRRCTLTRCFLVFVGPAAVIGHAATFEQAFVAGVEAGVVDEHHHRLAFYIQIGVIVPAQFGRINAIADEHHFAVFKHCFWRTVACAQHHLRAEFQRVRLARHVQCQAGALLCRGRHHRDSLNPAAIVARFETHALIVLDQIFDGLGLARATGASTFELV